MRLLAIDDLLMEDLKLAELPLMTDLSSSPEWASRRRDGISGSVLFGMAPQPARWNILFKPDDIESRDALFAALGGDIAEERRLLAMRGDDAQTRVTALAVPLKITEHNAFDISVDFESGDSVWRNESPTRTTHTFSSIYDRAMHLEVPGNTRTAPRIVLTPITQRTTLNEAAGWQYRRRVTIINLSDETMFRYPLRLDLSTTALVSGGKMQADGDDLRVWQDGTERERTILDPNTSATKIWFILEALRPNESATVDLVYGNPLAHDPPTLTYPNTPAIDLGESSNSFWSWPISPETAHYGLGIWHLATTLGGFADFTVPGAWQPLLTSPVQDNSDLHRVEESSYFTAGTNPETGGTDGHRATGDIKRVASHYDNPAFPVVPNPYDAIGFTHPFGITNLSFSWFWQNVNGICAFVTLQRFSSAERWVEFFNETSAPTVLSVMAPFIWNFVGRYPTQVAMAVWPKNRVEILKASYRDDIAWAMLDLDLWISLDFDANATITVGAEEAIYEPAVEFRLGGGMNLIPPFRSLIVGNGLRETGAGTRRCGLRFNQALVLDPETMRHEIWDSALITRAEILPARAVLTSEGWDNNGVNEETPSSAWLPIAPTRTFLPNATFDADIDGWEVGPSSTGSSVTLSWDGTNGGDANGSLQASITAVVVDAFDEIIGPLLPINGRESVWVSAWRTSTSVNLTPELRLRFYDETGAILAAITEVGWVVVANVEYRGVLAARVPDRATHFRVGLVGISATVGGPRIMRWDDITVNDTDLIVADTNMGAIQVDVDVPGRWL